jgi:hypothetical protein
MKDTWPVFMGGVLVLVVIFCGILYRTPKGEQRTIFLRRLGYRIFRVGFWIFVIIGMGVSKVIADSLRFLCVAIGAKYGPLAGYGTFGVMLLFMAGVCYIVYRMNKANKAAVKRGMK